jgi:hypothetical protein
MRAFLTACVVAAVIAVGAALVLNSVQKNVDVAYTAIGVRI